VSNVVVHWLEPGPPFPNFCRAFNDVDLATERFQAGADGRWFPVDPIDDGCPVRAELLLEGICELAVDVGRAGGDENLGGTAVRINRLIGFGPVTLNEAVVTGIDADGNFVMDGKMSWNAYQLNMLKVQDILVKQFNIEGRKNDGLENLAKLVKDLDSDSGGAETD